jgi:hypothetical protein
MSQYASMRCPGFSTNKSTCSVPRFPPFLASRPPPLTSVSPSLLLPLPLPPCLTASLSPCIQKEVLEWCRGSLVPLFPGPPPLLRLLGPLPPNQNPARMTSKDCGVLYTLRCVLYTCVLNCSTGSTATASLDVCPRTPLTESGRCSFG